tara:strand:- start:177 stop:359 length:183 start_codon:yes stop_codon:yes gene_type:complete
MIDQRHREQIDYEAKINSKGQRIQKKRETLQEERERERERGSMMSVRERGSMRSERERDY